MQSWLQGMINFAMTKNFEQFLKISVQQCYVVKNLEVKHLNQFEV